MKKCSIIQSSVSGILGFVFFLLILLPTVASAMIRTITIADGFDFPVGKPDAADYYNAQGMGIWNQKFRGYHLGEDWNKKCGGDCDLGEPVYSIANGEVVDVSYGAVWGNIVKIRHSLKDGRIIDSFYAHMQSVDVKEKQILKRGDEIGKIGKGDGNIFAAHLHFEIRDDIAIEKNIGYSKSQNTSGYLNPSEFIKTHRPGNTINLNLSPNEINGARLDWEKVAGDDFVKYEVYRSIEKDGTFNSSKRTLVYSTENKENITYEDTNLRPMTYYYSIQVTCEDGKVRYSNEVSFTQTNNPIPIEINIEKQSKPIIKDKKIYYGDLRYRKPGEYQIQYFDLADMKAKSQPITSATAKAPQEVDANSEYIVFSSQDPSTGFDIYALNLKNGTTIKLNTDNINVDQYGPNISENNMVVWYDLRNGTDFEIYFAELGGENSIDLRLVSASGNQRVPRMWGTKVVWTDTRTGNRTDIYYKDVLTNDEVLVAKDTLQISPDIWNGYITWATRGKLYLYNIETGVTEIIPTSGPIAYPRINEGKIVAQNDGGIFIYDITIQKSEKLTFAGFTPSNPYYSDGYIVFEHRPDLNSPNLDIYLIYY